MSLFQRKKEQALNELLEYAHAEQYTGLDDEMPDDCADWIGNLTEDELCEIVLDVYRKGL